MPEADQAAAAVKMQSAQRGMAARRMSKELAASAVVKEAAIDLVVEKGEGVPLGLTLRNSPAQPGQPGPQEEGLVYVKEVTPYSPAADAGLAAGDIIVSVKGEAGVAHDRARDLVGASGTTVRLSVRKHAVDLDAIGGAFSTGVAWPQLDESSRALWTSLGWDAKSWARGPSPPTEDLEWKQLGDGERAAAEGLGYSEATWNDMKKWSFAFKAEAEEAKAERIVFVREAKDLARQNGVRAGDVLVAVNGQKVGDHAEARDLIRMAGLEVRLELIRYDVGPPLLEVLNRVGLPEEKAAALRALLA